MKTLTPKRNARRAPGGVVETGQQASHKHTASAERWSVLAIKSTGASVVFNTYADEIEAQRVADQLRKVHCLARVEPARRDDVPGLQRRTP